MIIIAFNTMCLTIFIIPFERIYKHSEILYILKTLY